MATPSYGFFGLTSEDLKANAEEALGKAKGYIKENPEKSVAMAAGAGALLAAIAGVFLRKKK